MRSTIRRVRTEVGYVKFNASQFFRVSGSECGNVDFRRQQILNVRLVWLWLDERREIEYALAFDQFLPDQIFQLLMWSARSIMQYD